LIPRNDLTNAGCRTGTPLRSVPAATASVSWIYGAPFLWFGGRGPGIKLVAKPRIFSPAKAVKIGG